MLPKPATEDEEALDDKVSFSSTDTDSPKRQSSRWYLCLFIVIYGMIFNGTIFGYTSPALPSMPRCNATDCDNFFFIDDDRKSWVSSLASLGMPIGSLASGILMDIIGRKWTALVFHAGSYVTGYALIASTANSVWPLYIGRFVCGICQVSKTTIPRRLTSNTPLSPGLLQLRHRGLHSGVVLHPPPARHQRCPPQRPR